MAPVPLLGQNTTLEAFSRRFWYATDVSTRRGNGLTGMGITGAPEIMQEAGMAKFKITRRWPELYFGPLFLLVAAASVYCFVKGQGGEVGWLVSCQFLICSAIFLSFSYVLHEGKLRYRVYGDGWSVACSRADLMRELTAETILADDYISYFVPVHRFRTRSGVLLVRGCFFSVVKLVEALSPTEALERAVRKQMQPSRTFQGYGPKKLLVFVISLVAVLNVTFLVACMMFGTEAVIAEAWSMTLDTGQLPVFGGFLFGLIWGSSRQPRWTLIDDILTVDGKDCIPLVFVTKVSALKERRSRLRVSYSVKDEPRETFISQNSVNQSLLPLYFFLRADHSMPLPLPTAW